MNTNSHEFAFDSGAADIFFANPFVRIRVHSWLNVFSRELWQYPMECHILFSYPTLFLFTKSQNRRSKTLRTEMFLKHTKAFALLVFCALILPGAGVFA